MLKALGKYVLRSINYSYSQKAPQRAHNTAYAQIGKEIKRAKKTGVWINAKANYRKRYNEQIQLEKRKQEQRDLLIKEF